MHAHAKLILIIGIFCLLCGCISAPPGAATGDQNGGITDITDQTADYRVSFEEALADPAFREGGDPSGAGALVVYQVNGAGVDESGSARSWIFGIREKGEAYLRIYNANGWERIPWDGPLPEQPVDLTAVISPTELYRQQAAVIREEMEKGNVSVTDLDLAGSVYSVKIRAGTGISVLSFNSGTGEMITSA